MDFKRGRKADTDVMNRMTWKSRCGSYRIAHIICKFNTGTYYSAERKLPATGTWWPIEWYHNRKQNHTFRKYRTREAAEKVCNQHQQGGK